MPVRHFIDTQDFQAAELLAIIDLARQLKEADRAGACPRLLDGASLGMLFEEPSTRTRVSFEVAMTKLGGHALYLRPGEIHLGQRESIEDTANVLERMVDVIEARTLKHSTLTRLAAQADVPVINGLTDYNHPTQAMCDVMTMMEHAERGKPLSQCRVVFVGDATNVCNSLAQICTQMGMHFTHAAPPRYQIGSGVQAIARHNCRSSHGSLTVTADVSTAVRDADFLYTDLWWWIGQESEIPERRAAFMPTYQLNRALVAQAPTFCRIMHCLPASRGVEATDEVLDSPRSIIFDQAENRLHMEKGLLAWFVWPRLRRTDEHVRSNYRKQIDAFLEHSHGTPNRDFP
ncbi:MAG TPA: putrescine carbamoyltransferase [Steroidobacteraceae bacterium]|nr:putrescine carbamoyltransferase [Steroidobacteraceae bacterium]